MYVVVSPAGREGYSLAFLDDTGEVEQPSETVGADELGEAVEAIELESPRWVWHDTATFYPLVLAAGVRVERCHDLRLSRALLRASSLTAETALARAADGPWDKPVSPARSAAADSGAETLFDHEQLDSASTSTSTSTSTNEVTSSAGGGSPAPRPAGPGSLGAGSSGAGSSGSGSSGSGSSGAGSLLAGAAELLAVEEFRLQLATIRSATEPNRLRLLVAAESAGALIAAEMSHAGLPWREDVHDALLTELLGPRAPAGSRPAKLERLVAVIRHELGAASLNPDSPAEVLKALHSAGVAAETTRSWELQTIEHPVIEPLLEYKKLSRLLSANGWSWMESWVEGGRFSPDYVPGGVVSGRWATRGGGALQLPKQIRRAVTADSGWKLVVADAAQLEPRILAGVSADLTMARAGREKDLYLGIVESGAVETRAQAKIAMLGAMYGATTGESGRLLPRLGRAFPRALAFVEDAARAGERGEVVTSRLGRSAPRPNEDWWEAQAKVSEGAATERERQQARRQARDWGRFTRNFVVQASAADWALCWMADLRRRLTGFPPAPETGRAAVPFAQAPHLVFFLHDEVIVHSPASQAEAVADALHASAAAATRLLFGEFPLTVPLDISIVDSYADAD
ncbi:bifunctional 3'-5' exonuclease/DNA polymerase [soil metagenome]